MTENDPNPISEFPVLETERLIFREPILGDAAGTFYFISAYITNLE
jgi:hypothetical protein